MKASTLIGLLLVAAALIFAVGVVNMFVPMNAPPVYIPAPASSTP